MNSSLATVECDIVGVRVRLQGPPAILDGPLWERLSRFPARSASGPRLDLTVAGFTPPEPPPGEDYALELHPRGGLLGVRGFWLEGELDLAHARGHARVASRDAAGSVENFLRVALAHLLLDRGGFLLHACAAVTGDGQAVVAFGPSGAGKTTLASLAGGRPVLSDDLVALARGQDGLLVAVPSPFRDGGAPPRPSGHPVSTLLSLEQSTGQSLAPVGPGRGAALLVASMPFVLDQPGSAEKALALASAAAASPGVKTFRFTPSPDVWDFLESSP